MELAAAGDNMKKLREIARVHIARCEAGDMQATERSSRTPISRFEFPWRSVAIGPRGVGMVS
jgi:hypothetical protein